MTRMINAVMPITVEQTTVPPPGKYSRRSAYVLAPGLHVDVEPRIYEASEITCLYTSPAIERLEQIACLTVRPIVQLSDDLKISNCVNAEMVRLSAPTMHPKQQVAVFVLPKGVEVPDEHVLQYFLLPALVLDPEIAKRSMNAREAIVVRPALLERFKHLYRDKLHASDRLLRDILLQFRRRNARGANG